MATSLINLGPSTANTPPGQIGLNQNNCSMLLIILEFHVWSGGENYCPKDSQGAGGDDGGNLTNYIISFYMVSTAAYYPSSYTELKYQFCNLFLNLFVFIRLLKT